MLYLILNGLFGALFCKNIVLCSSQCASNKQQGGFIEFCDGNPTQCSSTNQQGGSISNKQFKKLFKKYTQYSVSKEALNSIHQMVENDLVHYLNNQNKDEYNNKVFTKLQ